LTVTKKKSFTRSGTSCSSAMGFCGDPELIFDKNLDLKMLRLCTGDWLSFVVDDAVCGDDVSDVIDVIDAVFELRFSSS
jgi:hypothetical protein